MTGAKGPEAGAWVIAETTDLPTRFARIVVTDDRGRYLVPDLPKAIIPSWDLKTLWVAGSAERGRSGILTPIDPKTGKPGTTVKVADAYNLYFTPDGHSAIVVAEALKRLEFRDPQTMTMQYNIATTQCSGVNHADFSIDGNFAYFTCEFSGGGLAKIDLAQRKVVSYLKLTRPGAAANGPAHNMPQDIRIAPDGKALFVADMEADGFTSLIPRPSNKWNSSRRLAVRTACTPVATVRSSM